MSMLQGFVCWTKRDLNETAVVDAVMPSEAVFLATHRPARIIKQEIGRTDGGVLCTEDNVLQDFLEPNRQLLLLPIIGGSGTGKSHLIRWLHAHIPETATRKVVYIPRYGTNLRSVIELILRGMDGPVFDELRRDLDKAADSLDETEAPERLLFELGLRIQNAPQQLHDRPAGPADRYRRHLIAELPKLLSDHIFKRRLLGPDGVVVRLTTEALLGRTREQKESPYEFTEADIPTDVSEIAKASEAAREIYAHLVGSPPLRMAAAALLNEQLEPAVRNLFGIGGQRVSEVMRRVRTTLLDQGMELVLFIEDFALLQGIQRELLDALIEAPTRDNQRVLCPIRTAMAVTSGYFASLDTARTRVAFGGYAYSLDIPVLESSDRDFDYATSFIATYLNAARLGSVRLEEARRAAGNNHEGPDWVPNACEVCPVHSECHEAFKSSREGYGLYPFSPAAINRMLKARQKEHFDPRDVLAWVIRLTLGEQEQDLRDGRFPSARYLGAYANPSLPTMDPELIAAIEQADRVNARRRVDVLTFWGDCPDKIVNLPRGVHQAFALPELEVDRIELKPVPAGDRPRSVDDRRRFEPQAEDDSQLAADLEDLRRWGTGAHTLPQNLAARLRRWIHAGIVARIEWNEEFWRQNDSWTNRNNGLILSLSSIRIANAAGGGGAKGAVTIDIEVSNDNQRLLQGLARFQNKGHWSLPRGEGPAVFRLYCDRMDDWAESVLQAVRAEQDGGTAVDPTSALVPMLLIGAKVLGVRGARSATFDGLVDAMLAPAPEPALATRGPLWTRLASACRERTGQADGRQELRQRLFERIAIAQGSGQPLAINVTRLLPHLKVAKTAGLPPEPDSRLPGGLVRHWREVSSRLQPAIREELDRLNAWHRDVIEHVGPEPNVDEITSSMRATMKLARTEGILGPPHLVNVIDDRIRDFRRAKLSLVGEVGQLVQSAGSSPPSRIVGDLGVDRDKQLDEIRRFVLDAVTVLNYSRSRLEQQLGALQQGAVNGLTEFRTELQRTVDVLKRFAHEGDGRGSLVGGNGDARSELGDPTADEGGKCL